MLFTQQTGFYNELENVLGTRNKKEHTHTQDIYTYKQTHKLARLIEWDLTMEWGQSDMEQRSPSALVSREAPRLPEVVALSGVLKDKVLGRQLGEKEQRVWATKQYRSDS